MSQTQRSDDIAGADTLSEDARRALSPLSAAVEDTFTELSRSVTEELARLSVDGRLTIRGMVDEMLDDLARLAAERLIADPLRQALSGDDGVAADALETILKQRLRNG